MSMLASVIGGVGEFDAFTKQIARDFDRKGPLGANGTARASIGNRGRGRRKKSGLWTHPSGICDMSMS